MTNAKDLDSRTFTVQLKPGKVQEKVVGAQTWVKIGLAPGIYTVTVAGEIGGYTTADSKAVMITSNQIAEVPLTLFAQQAKAATS